LSESLSGKTESAESFYIPFRLRPVVMLCISYTVLQALVFRPIVSFAFDILLLKSVADALILVGLGVLSWK